MGSATSGQFLSMQGAEVRQPSPVVAANQALVLSRSEKLSSASELKARRSLHAFDFLKTEVLIDVIVRLSINLDIGVHKIIEGGRILFGR